MKLSLRTAPIEGRSPEGRSPKGAESLQGAATDEESQPHKGTWRTRGRVARHLVILSRKSPQLPRWVAWTVAGLWPALVGVLVGTLLVVVIGQHLSSPFAAGVLLWLTAHQIPLVADTGTFSFLPLGLALIPLLTWRRSARWLGGQLSDRGGLRVRSVLPSVGLYVFFGLLLALLVRVGDFHSGLFGTVFGTATFAVLGVWLGIRRQAPSRLQLPNAFAGGTVAIAWFVLIGGALLAVAAVFGFDAMNESRASLSQGLGGQIGALALELVYLPNLVLWAAAYATGAGIAVGGGEVISPFSEGHVNLPDLPLFAAVPTEHPSWTAMLPIVIVIGGWIAAVAAQRRVPVHGLRRRLVRALVLAAFTFVFWIVAVRFSGGSLGDGRLEYVGPVLGTALAAAGLVLVGAAVWALVPTLASDARPVAGQLRDRVDRGVGFDWRVGSRAGNSGTPDSQASKGD